MAWSPDGKYLAYALAGHLDQGTGAADQVLILDVKSGDLTYSYKEHQLSVGTLAWSPNGKYIASGESNVVGSTVAKVWTAA